nr:hypothetical protein [uncultured Amphritea sp.]
MEKTWDEHKAFGEQKRYSTDYDVCKQILGRSLMGMAPDATMS